MADNGDIYLGPAGSEVYITPYGRKRKIFTDEDSRTERAASGKLRKDTKWKKYRFELPFEYIDGDKLNTVLALYELDTDLTLLMYNSPTTYFLSRTGLAPVVKIRPIDYELLALIGNGIYTGASLILDEV